MAPEIQGAASKGAALSFGMNWFCHFGSLCHVAQDRNPIGQDSHLLHLNPVFTFGWEWGAFMTVPPGLHTVDGRQCLDGNRTETRVLCRGCWHVDLLACAFSGGTQVGARWSEFSAGLIIRIKIENIRYREIVQEVRSERAT